MDDWSGYIGGIGRILLLTSQIAYGRIGHDRESCGEWSQGASVSRRKVLYYRTGRETWRKKMDSYTLLSTMQSLVNRTDLSDRLSAAERFVILFAMERLSALEKAADGINHEQTSRLLYDAAKFYHAHGERIRAIKYYRESQYLIDSNVGLKEAKDIVDGWPTPETVIGNAVVVVSDRNGRNDFAVGPFKGAHEANEYGEAHFSDSEDGQSWVWAPLCEANKP